MLEASRSWDGGGQRDLVGVAAGHVRNWRSSSLSSRMFACRAAATSFAKDGAATDVFARATARMRSTIETDSTTIRRGTAGPLGCRGMARAIVRVGLFRLTKSYL
jgi:hypothetical protein